MTTIYIAYKYNKNREIENLFITNEKNKAITLAIGDDYDEVINDETGEIVWKKGEKIMTNTNTTIYDRIQLGDTFHNSNGTDYIILAFDKEADVAILLNPKNGFTPYVGADGLRSNHWCYGHYFKTLQKACDWFNKETGTEDTNEDKNAIADFYVGVAFDNGSGEYFSTKKKLWKKLEELLMNSLRRTLMLKSTLALTLDDYLKYANKVLTKLFL